VKRIQVKRINRARLAASMSAVIVAALGFAIVRGTVATAASFPAECPWMDTSLSADQRARVLLDHSTLDQKTRWLDEQAANTPTQTSFGGSVYPVQVPCTPTIIYTDGPYGVTGQTGVTAFPAPISQAASFDLSTSLHKGEAVSTEAFTKRRNVILAPGVASGRTPLSGRTPEYFSEDPLLAGLMAGANISGIQEHDDTPTVAVLKHYVANEQELDRQRSSSNIDTRTMQEIYTLPFGIAVAEGDPGGVMCSYNQVNGVYACENKATLTDILRDEYGFSGYVVTDFGATHSLTSNPPSLVAGLDQELNRPRFWTPTTLHAALAAGTITEADIDQAAFRVVRTMIRQGLFDIPLPATGVTDASTPAHQALALDMAVKGSVLLRNEGALLPLGGHPRSIAVIGPTASNTPTNGISARTVCDGGVSCPNPVAAVDAITARAAADGSTVMFNNGADLDSAAATAAAADVAIVFGYNTQGEFNDRTNLALAGNGDALISAVAAANPRTVVVLQNGGPVEMPWLSSVRSVLEVWYAGVNQGTAIAQLLWGDANPSGRLPVTFPKSLADTPTAESPGQYPGVFADGTTVRPPGSIEIRQVNYAEGLEVGYRWYASQGIEPLFPFGFGLSYTTFQYSKLQITPTTTDGGKEIRIRFTLTNTGAVAGTEVAQAYVTLPNSTGEPSKRLVGWSNVALQPGETKHVEITLNASDLATRHLLQYWNNGTGAWSTADGSYTITVGGSFNTSLADTFTVHHSG
jgi:beta-glucosidase